MGVTYIGPSGAVGPSSPANKSMQEQMDNANTIALAPFRAALANAANVPVDILFVGDSVSEGQGATAVANRWVNQATQRLRTLYQPGGVAGGLGYLPGWYNSSSLPAPATIVGSPTQFLYTGLGGRGYQMASGNSLTWKVMGTSFDLHFAGQTTAPPLTVSIDGGTAAAVTATYAGTIEFRAVRYTFASRGIHTITVAATGGAYLDGITVYDQDEASGIRMHDASHLGWATTDYTYYLASNGSFPTSPITSQAQTVNPQCVVLALGANDYFHNASIGTTAGSTTMLANLQSIIALIRAGCTAPPTIIVFVPYNAVWTAGGGTGVTPEPESDFQTQLYNLALSDPALAVFDTSVRFPSYAQDTSGLYYTDFLHPSNKGHNYIGEQFAAFVDGGPTPFANTGRGIYGDASSGALVFDGTSTVAGYSPTSSVYTLTTDLYASTIVINSGVTVKTVGTRLLATQSITNNGTISNNGNNATTTVAGGSTGGNSLGAGLAGALSAAATAGTPASSTYPLFGGQGGAGGTSGSNAGGAGGVTAFSANLGSFHMYPFSVLGYILSSSGTITIAEGGGGGGSGGGDGTNKGGPGGGGGGIILLASPTIVNNGTISAIGGAGSISATANGAGGGGGGGGFVLLTGNVSGNAPVVTGGAGGALHGTGAAGSAGYTGNVIIVPA